MRKLFAAVLALALAAPAFAAEEPGVFKVPGTDSTIKFYGYVQLDTTLDFSGRVGDIEDNDWATNLFAVPEKDSLYAKKAKPQLYMTARTSRFGLTTNTPTDFGPLAVKLEGDFNAPNGFQSETFTNSVLFRLRHAYGTLGGFLAGQTWSTFLDLSAYPDVVDFNGPGDLALVRNPMLRYTFALAPGATLAVAAENARGTQYGASAPRKFQSVPDFHANLTYTANWGHFSLRAVTQKYDIFQTASVNAALPPINDSKSAWGVSGAASGSVKLGGDTLVAQFVGGQGVGRYLLNASGATQLNGYSQMGGNPGAFFIKDNGDLKLITVYAYHAGFTHVWNKAFRSNLVWSQTFIQDPKVDPTTGAAVSTSGNNVQKTLDQAFVNTFWGFAKNAELGLEYVWGQWTSFKGDSATPVALQGEAKGIMNRVNMTLHYNFY
jgi:hypothetical protein